LESPAQAIAAGANYPVGRPIVKSNNPALGASQIIEDMLRAA